MKATHIVVILSLLASTSWAQTPPAADPGEPLPPGAPTEPYELSAWCFGALDEYLIIYDEVKPDLRAIDKMWGSSVQDEKEPYAQDMAAARKERKVLAGAVQAAEKASPDAIAPRGLAAIKKGRSIWASVEIKTHRELARAWLSWGLPDRCDSNARELAANAAVLGAALKYNAPAPETPPAPDATPTPTPAPAPPAETPAPRPRN